MNYKEGIDWATQIWKNDFNRKERKYEFCIQTLKKFYQDIKGDNKYRLWEYKEAITYMAGADRFILSLNNEDIKAKRFKKV